MQPALDDMSPLEIINIHGPQQHAMDEWLQMFATANTLVVYFNDVN